MRGLFCMVPLLLLLMMTGCGKGRFSVTFDLEGEESGICRLIYYASDSKRGFINEAVTPIEKGHGALECPTARPTLVWLYSRDQQPSTCFYAERGDEISIKGKIGSPMEWEITGNDVNDDLTTWRRKNASILTSLEKGKINKAVAAYIKENPKNPAGAILLVTTYWRSENEKEFQTLRGMLKGDAAELMASDILSRNDLLTDAPARPAPLKSMGFPQYDSSMPDSTAVSWYQYKPTAAHTLIYLWNAGGAEESEHLDSIYAMEHSESSLLTIDLCAAADSLQWVHYASRTGTEATGGDVRGWLPRGLADPTVMALGVRRLPSFVVLGKKGEVIYSGQDFEKARQYTR